MPEEAGEADRERAQPFATRGAVATEEGIEEEREDQLRGDQRLHHHDRPEAHRPCLQAIGADVGSEAEDPHRPPEQPRESSAAVVRGFVLLQHARRGKAEGRCQGERNVDRGVARHARPV